jgi:hypothetical protein
MRARLVLLIIISLAMQGAASFIARAAEPVTVVAFGLANPRGFANDADHELLVAVNGPPGPTAGVVAVSAGCPKAIVAGLPAYRIVFSAVTGIADVAVLAGQRYLLLSGGDIDRGNTPNGLYRFDDAGNFTLVADVSHFIRDHPVADRPHDFDTDGQPYALLPMGDSFWATEGNSNQILRLGLDGSVDRIADLSVGHPIPTGIAPAPGGGAYVGFLTHAPYREGAATVVQVSPDGLVTPVWSGLTLVSALAVDADGALYALEMATGIDEADPHSIVPGTGKIVRKTGPTTAEDVVTGLALPVAMEFGSDGALYVAEPAFGADHGEGSILRVDLTDGTPVAVPPALNAPANCS